MYVFVSHGYCMYVFVSHRYCMYMFVSMFKSSCGILTQEVIWLNDNCLSPVSNTVKAVIWGSRFMWGLGCNT